MEHVRISRSKQWATPAGHPFTMACGLFLLSLALRGFQLSTSPLWFDEIYGYQLGQLGLREIIRNSQVDPHPPLFYLLQWTGSGLGRFRTEWGWRWILVLSGALTVPLMYATAHVFTHRSSAFVAGLLLAVSPTHLYFSQEARAPAFVTFLAAVSGWLVARLARSPGRKHAWVALTLVTLIGLWSSYSYLMIVGVQAIFLVVVLGQWRRALVPGLVVVSGCLILARYLVAALGGVLQQHRQSLALGIIPMMQALLAGEPLRYGWFWGNLWLPVLLSLLALLGMWRSWQLWSWSGIYSSMQVLLPLVGFFALGAPLFGLKLTLSESKQFMVLLPAFFVLVAIGLDKVRELWPPWLGHVLLLFVCAVVLVGSMEALRRYWSTPKSPEGSAVLAAASQFRPGDAVVSLDYSLDAALSFYMPWVRPYTRPQRIGDDYLFSRSTAVVIAQQAKVTRNEKLAAIRAHTRVWVLGPRRPDDHLQRVLTAGCSLAQEQWYPPFPVVLLDHCR